MSDAGCMGHGKALLPLQLSPLLVATPLLMPLPLLPLPVSPLLVAAPLLMPLPFHRLLQTATTASSVTSAPPTAANCSCPSQTPPRVLHRSLCSSPSCAPMMTWLERMSCAAVAAAVSRPAYRALGRSMPLSHSCSPSRSPSLTWGPTARSESCTGEG